MHITLAKAALAVYNPDGNTISNPDKVISNMNDPDLISVKCYEVNDLQSTVSYYSGKTIIAIRGVDGFMSLFDMIDIWSDVSTMSTIYADIINLWKLMEKDLPLYGNNKVYLTGHSMGGVIALIIQQKSNFNFEEIVTFGCPRIGTTDWLKENEYSYITNCKSYTRYYAKYDPIVHLLPKILNYNHPSDDVHITSIKLPSVLTYNIIGYIYGLQNHSMQGYLNKLTELHLQE